VAVSFPAATRPPGGRRLDRSAPVVSNCLPKRHCRKTCADRPYRRLRQTSRIKCFGMGLQDIERGRIPTFHWSTPAAPDARMTVSLVFVDPREKSPSHPPLCYGNREDPQSVLCLSWAYLGEAASCIDPNWPHGRCADCKPTTRMNGGREKSGYRELAMTTIIPLSTAIFNHRRRGRMPRHAS